MDGNQLLIDQALLGRYVTELAAFGVLQGGGMYRPLYGDAWEEALKQTALWMREAGLAVRRDAAGNLYGRLEGRGGGPAIVTGSHIDTVMAGGRLDGAYGILAGIVAVRVLRERFGAPSRPIEVLATCEEEGSRFSVNFWGARALAGRIAPGEAEQACDQSGMTLAEAMRGRGLDPNHLPAARRTPADMAAFLEVHIEQGAVLEQAGVPLGIVTGIAGTTHLRVTVTGRPNHAGTTPMALRSDALAGAAAMVAAVEAEALGMGSPAVATVGSLQVEPGQINVVPGTVTFTVDARHADRNGQTELVRRITAAFRTLAAGRGLGVTIDTLRDHSPVPMDRPLMAAFGAAAEQAGVSSMRMVSGAGHDAQILASICPAAMLFVPSVGGLSHCPEEDTPLADLVRGADILARVLQQLCYEPQGD